ncbi:hypothetical protein Leryth_015158 [Lithospermum erythrorhizon]|nr:hypothetical protein Leryth_015158 [Lithospermum erythrorhizon]
MAIEFETHNMVVMSPRISFSHDISQMETTPVEQYIRSGSTSSSVDFDFCVFRESFDQDQSSSADELFSGGKILPIEIKRRLLPSPSKKKEQPPIEKEPNSKKDISGEMSRVVSESDDKKNSSKSFWRFKRSSSLNCGSGYARTLCPIPLLSRSNSTGSSTSSKRSSTKCNNSGKFVGTKASHCCGTGHHQKPPLKDKHGYHHSQRVNFNPILNVPTASLFGLGSMFSCSKEKNKKI